MANAVLLPLYHARRFSRFQHVGISARYWMLTNHIRHVGRNITSTRVLQQQLQYSERCSSVNKTSTLFNTIIQRQYSTSKEQGQSNNGPTDKLPHQLSLHFKGYARLLSKYCKAGDVEAAIGLLWQVRPFDLSPHSNQYIMVLSSLVENGYLR